MRGVAAFSGCAGPVPTALPRGATPSGHALAARPGLGLGASRPTKFAHRRAGSFLANFGP